MQDRLSARESGASGDPPLMTLARALSPDSRPRTTIKPFYFLFRGPGRGNVPWATPRTFCDVWRTRIPSKSACRRLLLLHLLARRPRPRPPRRASEGVRGRRAHPSARPFLAPHVYPGSGAANHGASSNPVGSAGAPRHVPDAAAAAASSSSSFLCRLCSYTARDVVDLLAHNQQHKWDEELHHQQASSEARPQRIFKCPYCDVQVKGRKAIEIHVINHSAGDEGPERLYWCSFCTLKCRSAPGLSSHLKRHAYQGDF
nr:protein glass-like [Penaeus vannamei]